MPHLLILILFAGSILAQPESGPSTDSAVSIQYIANEGVYISSAEHHILIDALYREGVSGYMTIDPALLEQLESAAGPYAQTDLLLVTHLHPDHFDARSVARHLQHNPQATLVAGGDVAELLRAEPDEAGERMRRVREINLEWQQDTTLEVDGLRLRAMRTRHGWFKNYGLDHLGFLLDLPGHTILHLGDLEMSAENLEHFQLPEKKIDIAILPHWILTYDKGRELVRMYIKPAEIIAVHVSPDKAGEISRDILQYFPDAHVFTAAGQTVHFSAGTGL